MLVHVEDQEAIQLYRPRIRLEQGYKTQVPGYTGTLPRYRGIREVLLPRDNVEGTLCGQGSCIFCCLSRNDCCTLLSNNIRSTKISA